MFDLAWIREHPDAFDRGLARRGLAPQTNAVLDLDRKHRAAQTALQERQERRNAVSKQIGVGKRQGADTGQLEDEVAAIKADMHRLETDARAHSIALQERLAGLPNLPADDVPDGLDAAANKELRVEGKKPDFSFEPKEHFELGEGLGQMDFQARGQAFRRPLRRPQGHPCPG